MIRRLLLIAIVSVLSACGTLPPSSAAPAYDESKPLALPCLAKPENIQGVWYVHVARDPQGKADEPQHFATGPFVARVSAWVTFEGNVEQFVTVVVGSGEDRARVDTGRVSTGRMMTGKRIVNTEPKRCEAFEPALQHEY